MTHRFPIKEIAAQAGLSTATVDRVINGRPHVSPQTRARVAAALRELEGQEAQLSARGRRLFVDLVVEAPRRFSAEIRAATEAVLPRLGGAVLRPRFDFHERMEAAQTVAILDRIAGRGSQGVVLKARDTGPIRAAIGRLAARGIPVVTLLTDVEAPGRLAYAGLDNAAAGRTAAFLMAQMLGGQPGVVLTTMSDSAFAGEEARFAGFAADLARLAPGLVIRDASGGGGLSDGTAEKVGQALADLPDIRGVYSMGGGNRTILAQLDKAGIAPQVYIAHDLDRENRALLRQGRLTVVLEHDLRADMETAFRHLLAAHRIGPGPDRPGPSDIRVITPANLPGV
ncbi:LacI family DNA-binding transcriptional regulator [Loktanella sp. IMCC34160]|uniref:LacI family DNA-binding transcriptional regulator n=1 Tax=Loktanella sp. IMCC34160 TaxID=2510646 RepID=UPI00101C39FB|nr:LacI family DNA-binding transcriptional regulator [Loktanella sp. IMCC34160]RYG91986.1 LacI family DNA-binding transcriptional regulator [Loktanella sp. IMCC34160]